MNKNRTIPTLIAISAIFFTAWCATNALGSINLTNIPFSVSFTNNSGVPDTSNEGRALTYDGLYVVGLSSPSGKGFFYNVASNTNWWPIGGGAAATICTGVGYRTTNGGLQEVVLSGITSSGYGNWMTGDGGVTWGAKRRDTSLGTSPWGPCAANGLAGTSSDIFYSGFFDSSSSVNWRVGQMSGVWPMTPSWANKSISANQGGQMWGISSTGRSVGTRKNTSGGPNLSFYYDWVSGGGTPTGAALNGLDGTAKGIAFSISADGNTIFGHSPTISDQVNNHGYKLVSPLSSPTITALPEFSDTGGSTSRDIPYGCMVDGRYASGMNYRGRETAVLWDTSSSDPSVWTINDLYGLVAWNVDTNIFARLMRAYSVATNAAGDLVITGTGFDSTAGATRAFLMTLPKWIAAIGFPGHQTVNYGANVTFSLVTNGTDQLTYQWYKNGTIMAGQTTRSLTFNNVSCAGGEAGNYNCVVNNTAISAVVTGYVATLTVLDPYITTQPLNRTNVSGTSAYFTIAAGGAPTLSYQWQRGGNPLSDGTAANGSVIAGASSSALTISNLHLDDTDASYRCVVTTSAGGCTATSGARALQVVGRPVITSITPAFPGWTLAIDGPSGQKNAVLYSTDLSLPLGSWTVLNGITNNLFGGGLDSATDSSAADPRRFYILLAPYPLTLP